MARCWIFLDRENYFFQIGVVVLKLVQTSFLDTKLWSSDIFLQQQIHDTSKEMLNNDYGVL